ncbi:hypothetical protein [Candidatus Poriferisodalis sp.]|uniref:hypothetical protein n=1 Tax=Candidatus Poriferisodalis sp. TaxID=3101277 RepID=UPI003C6EC523
MPDVASANAADRRKDGPSANGAPQFSGDEFVASVARSLVQAAKQAHLVAHQTGTGVAYSRDGQFGIYKPDPAMYEDLVPPPFEDEQILATSADK